MNPACLTRIDLDQPTLPGFRQFISSWLYRGDGFTFLVDPGPLSTIPKLCAELGRLGVDRLDYVLLTHIHIDHAGGTGELLRAFPGASVICHPEGVRHMLAPEKLWEGSRKVLGELAEAYGEIVPVPADSIGFSETVGATGVRVFLTPGHAQHHCCYLLDDLLFGGEVAGVRCETAQGSFMRPATPPRFIPQVALDSLERMIELAPRYLVFAHHGMVDDAKGHLLVAHDQLRLWVRGVIETMGKPGDDRSQALREWLMERDGHFARVELLPPDIKVRESQFFANTLRGMTEYVDSLTPTERLAHISESV